MVRAVALTGGDHGRGWRRGLLDGPGLPGVRWPGRGASPTRCPRCSAEIPASDRGAVAPVAAGGPAPVRSAAGWPCSKSVGPQAAEASAGSSLARRLRFPLPPCRPSPRTGSGRTNQRTRQHRHRRPRRRPPNTRPTVTSSTRSTARQAQREHHQPPTRTAGARAGRSGSFTPRPNVMRCAAAGATSRPVVTAASSNVTT